MQKKASLQAKEGLFENEAECALCEGGMCSVRGRKVFGVKAVNDWRRAETKKDGIAPFFFCNYLCERDFEIVVDVC